MNNKCITGLSPRGHCGAAAYCPEPHNCCAACKLDCNVRCGFLADRKGQANDWGKCLGYCSDPCPNCGRVRLERYENGKEVCEKCRWCPQEDRYVFDDEIYPPEEDYHGPLATVPSL